MITLLCEHQCVFVCVKKKTSSPICLLCQPMRTMETVALGCGAATVEY